MLILLHLHLNWWHSYGCNWRGVLCWKLARCRNQSMHSHIYITIFVYRTFPGFLSAICIFFGLLELSLHWLLHFELCDCLRTLYEPANYTKKTWTCANCLYRINHSLVHVVLLDAPVLTNSFLRANHQRNPQRHQTLPVYFHDYHLLLRQRNFDYWWVRLVWLNKSFWDGTSDSALSRPNCCRLLARLVQLIVRKLPDWRLREQLELKIALDLLCTRNILH